MVDVLDIVRDQYDQTITSGANPGPLVLNGASGSASATASSGLAVSFASSTPAICDVDAVIGALTILGGGVCEITADQAGDGNYNAAPQVSQQVVIERADQTITFGPNPGPLTVGASASVSATASSGLTVSFGTITPLVCSVDSVSGAITTLTSGSCVVTADQAGDDDCRPADQVAQIVVIEEVVAAIFSDGFED